MQPRCSADIALQGGDDRRPLVDYSMGGGRGMPPSRPERKRTVALYGMLSHPPDPLNKLPTLCGPVCDRLRWV